jgi:alpha-mannosidase
LLYTDPVWGRWTGCAGFTITDSGTLTVSWVKPAEEGNALIIRLHETVGASGSLRFTSERYSTAMLTDIREGEGISLTADARGLFAAPYRAHQILTLILSEVEKENPSG